MSNVEWESDTETEEKETDNPRLLISTEIENIVAGLQFAPKHNPIQENIINIHKEKTRRKLLTISIRPSKILELKKDILKAFYKSVIATGEAVGVNAAQSIGEPTTQMTLNSFDYLDKIFVKDNNLNFSGNIGDFVESQIMNASTDKIQYLENDTTFVDISHKDFKVISVDEDGQIRWRLLEAVTKHLPGKDGKETLIKVITEGGRVVRATKAKSFLAKRNNKIIGITGEELKIGDCLPITIKYPEIETRGIYIENMCDTMVELNNDFGFLLGTILATDEFLNIKNNNSKFLEKLVLIKNKYESIFNSICKYFCDNNGKHIPSFVYTANKEFIIGLLDGYFSSNGFMTSNVLCVNCDTEELTFGIMELLSIFNIYSSKTNGIEEIIANISSLKHKTKWTLKIDEPFFINKFQSTIFISNNNLYNNIQYLLLKYSKSNPIIEPNFFQPIKTEHLDGEYNINYLKKELLNPKISNTDKNIIKIAIDSNVIYEKVVYIVNIESSHSHVYDFTVKDTRNFCLLGGLHIRDTFHSTGISAKNVTLGFPRAKECFNSTKTPSNPTCTIYLLKNNAEPDQLHTTIDHFVEATVDDLLLSWKVYDPENYKTYFWHIAWFKFNPTFGALTEHDWCLRLTFNIEKLYEKNITVKQIALKLKSIFEDIRCIPSPLNLGIVDIIINCENISMDGARLAELVNINSDEDSCCFYMNKIISPKVRGQLISGINGIKKLYRRKAKPNDTFGNIPLKKSIASRIKTEEEWIIDTDGTNLLEILAQENIDTERTMSNDMWEIFNMFGIEAARTYLFLEFMNIVNSGGISINKVHIEVLIDKMTYTGSIRSIARFGVETVQYDPIARATFEEVMSQLLTSAMFSEKDNLNGISSNIVLGTKINAGTGCVNLENIQLNIVAPPLDKQKDFIPNDSEIISEEI